MANENSQHDKQIRMTTAPVEKLVLKLAIPTIISMLVTTFYNMADTFFVGKLNNTSATGAVGVVFPLMVIIQAVGFFFGHGSGNFISRKLGEENVNEAETMASCGFFYALIAGTLILIIGLIFRSPIAAVLGATETIKPYALEYMQYIFIGAPYMCASLVLNNQLRYQGNAIFSMAGLVTGAVLNIGLDPLFIFALNMGVSGAALATIISQAVSFIILWIGCQKSDSLKIKLKKFTFKFNFLSEITRGGLPSLLRQGLASVATMVLNNVIGVYGDSAVAAMSIVTRITTFLGSATLGFGQGFQPVCGYNYGAKKFDRVKKAFTFCIKSGSIFLLVLSAIMFALSPYLISLFQSNDDKVIEIGTIVLRIQLCTLPLTVTIVLANMMYQTIGRVGGATVLAVSRQGLFLIIAVLTLPLAFGIWGVYIAQSVADVCSFALAVPLIVARFKRMKS